MDLEKKQTIVLFSFVGIITIGCIVGTSLAALRYNHVFEKNGNVRLIDEDGAEIIIDNYFKNTKNSRGTIHEISRNIGRYQYNNGISAKEEDKIKLLVTKHNYNIGLCEGGDFKACNNSSDTSAPLHRFTHTKGFVKMNGEGLFNETSICKSIEANGDTHFINTGTSPKDLLHFKLHDLPSD